MIPIFNRKFLLADGNPKERNNRLDFCMTLPDTDIKINGSEYLLLAHSEKYIEAIRQACLRRNKVGGNMTSPETFDVACLAVGATIMASMSPGTFAIVRPPGHHATYNLPPREIGLGYCFFNDMGIAVKKLIEEHGKRVFVFDFDLHHGNALEELFFDKDGVAYFSTHQRDIWPYTGTQTRKNCINIPLPRGINDEEYLRIVMPALKRALSDFKPDVVALYSGFDGFDSDNGHLFPEQGFNLTKKTYTRIKQELSGYPFFAVLGGGYNPESIRSGLEVFLNEGAVAKS